MSENTLPGDSAADLPSYNVGTSRDRITGPPRTVNQFPVVDWRPKPAGPGELPAQFYVICLRPDNEVGLPYIVWTIAYDPGYQGGIWVAGNGRYDLTWDRAQQVLDERAACEPTAAVAATGYTAEAQESGPSAASTASGLPAPSSGGSHAITTPACGEQRLARAALTFLTEPANPILGALIRLTTPAYALGCIKNGVIPAGIAADIGQPETVLQQTLKAWRSRTRNLPDLADLAVYERHGIRLLCPSDKDWPKALDDLQDSCPYALWVRGDLDLRTSCAKSVTIVGSRAASGYGAHVAREIAADLAADGWTIVSGGAYGIDAAAHRGALAAGGTNIAVLASGVDSPYPAGHADMFAAIASNGLVISEWPPGSRATRLRFLARNRVTAALASGTVIVEAGEHSGTLNTARHAADLGRPLMAVPGPVTSAQSAGCHRIIRDRSAALVCHAADIAEVLVRTANDRDRLEGGK